MPVLTRTQMHIEIDMNITKLNSYPSSILDPLVKDIFLNKIITLFVTSEIDKANKPDENKRVPFRILTHGDILAKYNNLYTLIKVDDTLTPLTVIDTSFFQYTLPTDLFRFEASFASIRPIDCSTLSYTQIPNMLLDTYDIISFNTNPFGGGSKYMGTILESSKLRLYHLGRYTISKVGVIYIKKPAIITNNVNCDLPESVHTIIVENTIKYIINTVNNGSYQEVLNSSKK